MNITDIDNFRVSGTFSTQLRIEAQVYDIQTEREYEAYCNPNKTQSELAKYPDTIGPNEIRIWRNHIRYGLYVKDKRVAVSNPGWVSHISDEEASAILTGRGSARLTTNHPVIVLNRDEPEINKSGKWKDWLCFVNTMMEEGPNLDPSRFEVMLIPDYSNAYGRPASWSTWFDFMEDVHSLQNDMIDAYRDKLEPAAYPIAELRYNAGMSQDKFSKAAGISKSTLVRAEKGENVSVGLLLKMATAAGKVLNISFD